MGSQAQTKASVKHNRTKDAITIRPDKETGARIRQAAADRGMTVTDLILAAVSQYLRGK